MVTLSVYSLCFVSSVCQRKTNCKSANACTHLIRQQWQLIKKKEKSCREREPAKNRAGGTARAEVVMQTLSCWEKVKWHACWTMHNEWSEASYAITIWKLTLRENIHSQFLSLDWRREKRRGVNNMGLCVSTRNSCWVMTEFFDMIS